MGGILGLILFLIVVYVLIMLAAGTVNFLIGLIIPIIIWGVIGWLAGKMVRGGGYGTLNNILLGLLGGIVGSIVFNLIGLNRVDDIFLIGNIIVGVVGSLIVIFVARTFGNRTFGR